MRALVHGFWSPRDNHLFTDKMVALAKEIASENQPVMLVDADIESPLLIDLFPEITGQREDVIGLTHFLADPQKVPHKARSPRYVGDALIKTSDNLFVLVTTTSPDLLVNTICDGSSVDRFKYLAENLREVSRQRNIRHAILRLGRGLSDQAIVWWSELDQLIICQPDGEINPSWAEMAKLAASALEPHQTAHLSAPEKLEAGVIVNCLQNK